MLELRSFPQYIYYRIEREQSGRLEGKWSWRMWDASRRELACKSWRARVENGD